MFPKQAPTTDHDVDLSADVYQAYAKLCQDCGAKRGAFMTGPRMPPLPARPRPCTCCGSANTVWQKA